MSDWDRANRAVTESMEEYVDRYSLALLLEQLADLCAEKAEHVQTNWQDSDIAGDWSKAARYLDRVAATRTVHAVGTPAASAFSQPLDPLTHKTVRQ